MPVAFDTAGMERHDERTWFDPRTGDQVSLTYIGMVPDIPAPLDDLALLRRKLAEETAETGSIIEAHVVRLGGVPALFQLIKLPIPGQDTGLAFIAAFTVPRAGCSAVLRIQCAEGQTTGVRESAVAAQVGFDQCFPPHPYAPDVRGQLPYNVADEAGWDQHFPDHPLTRARAWSHRMLATAQVDPQFAALPPFELAGSRPSGPPPVGRPADAAPQEAPSFAQPADPPHASRPADPPHAFGQPASPADASHTFGQPADSPHSSAPPFDQPAELPHTNPGRPFSQPADTPAHSFDQPADPPHTNAAHTVDQPANTPAQPFDQPANPPHANPDHPFSQPTDTPAHGFDQSTNPPRANPAHAFGQPADTPAQPFDQPADPPHTNAAHTVDQPANTPPQPFDQPAAPSRTFGQPADTPSHPFEPPADPAHTFGQPADPSHPDPAPPFIQPADTDPAHAFDQPSEAPEPIARPAAPAIPEPATPAFAEPTPAPQTPARPSLFTEQPAGESLFTDAFAEPPAAEAPAPPVEQGDVLHTVLVGLPLAGYLPLWREDGVTFWRMSDPEAVRARLGAGVESRSEIDSRRFREAAMFSPSRGTLFLMDRYRDETGHLGGTSTQLTAASKDEAYAAVDDRALSEMYTWLGEVVLSAVRRGEFVAIESGGWAVSMTPVMLAMLRTDGREWHSVVEASPVPEGAPVWRDQQPVDGNTQVLASPATDQTVRATGLLTRFAVAAWGVHPFQLGLSFGPNPTL